MRPNEIIDLTGSLESSNNSHSGRTDEKVIQALHKFDVNFEEIKKEVHILDFEILQSHEKDTNSIFADYESVSYKIIFMTYNLEFLIRLLTFQNDNQNQILKIDIQPKMTNIKKEIEYCCNSLQRRRNLNLMFKILITFSRFVESRRLVCDLILKKNRNVKIEENKDGGIIIVYEDQRRNVRVGIFWSIACSSVHEVTDVIEVYYKLVELPNKIDIKYKLNMITEPCLDFTTKFHLWTSLIDDLSEKTLCVVIDIMPNTSMRNSFSNPCREGQQLPVLSSGSEDPVVVDKISSPLERTEISNSKKDAESEAEGVTILSSDGEVAQKKELDCAKNVCKKGKAFKEKLNTSSTETTLLSSDEEDAQKKNLDFAEHVCNEGRALKKKTTKTATELIETAPVLAYLKLKKSDGSSPLQQSKTLNSQTSKHNVVKRLAARFCGLEMFKSKVKTRINLRNKRTELKKTIDSSDSEDSSKNLSGTNKHKKKRKLSIDYSGDSDYLENNETKSEKNNSNIRYQKSLEKRKLHSSGKRTAIRGYRKSPRLKPLYNKQERNNLLSPKLSHFLRTPQKHLDSVPSTSPKEKPTVSVATSTVSPSKGLVLISDNSAFINSVVPNNLLNTIAPKDGVDVNTPPKNVRTRLVPDTPVGSSPSFVELNLISPLKKTKITPKVIDDDLEITSVTYIIPD